MRSRCSFSVGISWVCAILNALQVTLVVLDFNRASLLASGEYGDNLWMYVRAIITAIPWTFEPRSPQEVYWMAGGLLVGTVISLVLIRRAEKKSYVGQLGMNFVMIFQRCVCDVLAFPIYWRLAYSVESVFENGVSQDSMILVTLHTVNVCILFFNFYLVAVFIVPFGFVPRCKLDLYDGKMYIFVPLTRFVMTLLIALERMAATVPSTFACLGFTLGFAVWLFYFRVITVVHTTLVGMWMEMGPIMAAPIVMAFRLYRNDWLVVTGVVLVVYVLLVVFFWWVRRAMTRRALAIFEPFMREDQASTGVPMVVLGAMSSVLRSVGQEDGDPEPFTKFLDKVRSEKTSYVIEVARFLAVFPSKRERLRNELRNLTSKNHHNGFVLYMFRKQLKRVEGSLGERDTMELGSVQRSFIVHFHLFWSARFEKRIFRAFKEAMSTAYFYRETKAAFRSALVRSPFDAAMRSQLAEFRLLACGDYEGYLRESHLAKLLKAGKKVMRDPILQPMSVVNPRLLQYCTDDEMSGDMSTTSVSLTGQSGRRSSSINPFPFSGIPLPTDDAHSAREQEKQKPVASFLTRSKRCMPLISILHYVLPLVTLTMILCVILPEHSETIDKVDSIRESMLDLSQSHAKTVSIMYVPYLLSQKSFDDNDESACRTAVATVPAYLLNEYKPDAVGGLVSYSSAMIVTAMRVLANGMNVSCICSQLSEYPSRMRETSLNWTIELMNTVEYIINETVAMRELEDLGTEVFQIELGLVASYILVFIASLVILLIQTNRGLEKQNLEHLASPTRLSRFVVQRGEEAWELLRDVSTDTGSRDDSQRLTASNDGTEGSSTWQVEMGRRSSTGHIKRVRKSDSGTLDDDRAYLPTSRQSSCTMLVEAHRIDDSSCGDFTEDAESHVTDEIYVEEDMMSENPVDEVVAEVRKNDRGTCWWMFVVLYWPFLSIMVIVVSLTIPVRRGISERLPYADVALEIEKGLNASVLLLSAVFGKVIDEPALAMDVDALKSLNTTVLNASASLVSYYSNSQSIGNERVTPMDVVESMVDGKVIDTERWAKWYLPSFIALSLISLDETMDDGVVALESSSVRNYWCFAISAICMCVFFIAAGAYDIIEFNEAFSSLFHYPSLVSGKKQKESDVIKKLLRADNMPSNLIIVTTIQNIGDIYSATENTKLIIKKPAIELIGQKLDDVFPFVDEKLGLREYTMPDKKTKKIFSCKTTKMKYVRKTTLMEEKTLSQSSKPTVGKSIDPNVISFLPIHFAKMFVHDDQMEFNFTNTFVILIRISSALPQARLDKIFNAANVASQNYTHVHIFDLEGSRISLLTDDDTSVLTVMLFVRDLLAEMQMAVRGTTELGIISCIISYQEKFNLSIGHADYPYLADDCADLSSLQYALYQLPEKAIAFDAHAAPRFSCILRSAPPIPIPDDDHIFQVIDFGELTTELLLQLR